MQKALHVLHRANPEPGNLVFFTQLLGAGGWEGLPGCRQGLLPCPLLGGGGRFQRLQPLKDANSFCSMQTSPENLREKRAASPQGPTATVIISLDNSSTATLQPG